MNRLEEALLQTDFSKYTDLKVRLKKELFVSSPFRRLPDEDAELVNAAQGISVKVPDPIKAPSGWKQQE